MANFLLRSHTFFVSTTSLDTTHVIIHVFSLFVVVQLTVLCHCTDFKLSSLQLRMQVQNTLNATTKQS